MNWISQYRLDTLGQVFQRGEYTEGGYQRMNFLSSREQMVGSDKIQMGGNCCEFLSIRRRLIAEKSRRGSENR